MHPFQLPDTDSFNIKECDIAGRECVLITPKSMGVVWNEQNKVFRSSIWTKDTMEPVSLGFRKFVNLGESPEFEPNDEYTDLEIIRKIDGSCLIVSHFNNKTIIRTRGTTDATTLSNGHEIDFLKTKYPKVFQLKHTAWTNPEDYTFLYEWTTPTNRIVLNESPEPTLWLIGAVRHEDYSYVSQDDLDKWAIGLNVLRPERFNLTLPRLKVFLEHNKTIEGVVLYANSGQILKKIKTPRYLYLHRVFTGIKNLNNLIEIWAENNYLEIDDFKHYLGTTFDWELVTSLKVLIDELEIKWNTLKQTFIEIKSFVKDLETSVPTRKEQASIIFKKYGPWSVVAFNALDGKTESKPEKYFKLM